MKTLVICITHLMGGLATAALSAERGFFPHAAVKAWHGQRFSILRIAELEDLQNRRVIIENQIGSFPQDVEALQVEIQHNAALSRALRARGVQIRNIGAAQQSLNGSMIFYLR